MKTVESVPNNQQKDKTAPSAESTGWEAVEEMGGDGKTEANWDNIADGIEPATATEDESDETEALVDSPEKMQEAIDHFKDDCRKSIMYHPGVEKDELKDKIKNGLISGAASHYRIPGYGLFKDAKDRHPEDVEWLERAFEKAFSAVEHEQEDVISYLEKAYQDAKKSHPEASDDDAVNDAIKISLTSATGAHLRMPGYGLFEDAKNRRPEDQAWIEYLYEKAISASGAQSETQGVAEGADTGNNSAGGGKKDGFFSRLFGRGK